MMKLGTVNIQQRNRNLKEEFTKALNEDRMIQGWHTWRNGDGQIDGYKHGTYRGKPVTAVVSKYLGGHDYGVDAFIVPGHLDLDYKSIDMPNDRSVMWKNSAILDDGEDGWEENQENIDHLMDDDPPHIWRNLKGPRI